MRLYPALTLVRIILWAYLEKFGSFAKLIDGAISQPVNTFESVIGEFFYINSLKSVSPDTTLPTRLSDHRILLIEKGQGDVFIDDKRLPIANNELFLMAKGQAYMFSSDVILTGYVLSFGDCFWEKVPASASNCKAVLFNNASANQHLPLTKPEFRELTVLFNALHLEFQLPAYINQTDALAAFLKIIMIKIANVKLTEEATFDSKDYILYRKFMELLSSNYKSYREVNDYAVMLNITPRRLSNICKRCNNRAAKEIIGGQLIAEAKRSLQFSASTIKEIAYHLNFNTPEQFSHFFKKSTSLSPVNYRNQFQVVS